MDFPKKTRVIWWRYGKEHLDGDAPESYRRNPPEVIQAHLDARLTKVRTTPHERWQWWQLSDNLLLEVPEGRNYNQNSLIYYLIDCGLTVVENVVLPEQPRFKWYIHIADTYFDATLGAWVQKDLFTDVIFANDGYHEVLDLDDLGTALELALLTPQEASMVLKRTQHLLDDIAAARFPYPVLAEARSSWAAFSAQLGRP